VRRLDAAFLGSPLGIFYERAWRSGEKKRENGGEGKRKA